MIQHFKHCAMHCKPHQGIMSVDGEEQPIQVGDCIFFRSYAQHGLKNTGETVLRYLSAASPSFTLEQCREWWPLEPVNSAR